MYSQYAENEAILRRYFPLLNYSLNLKRVLNRNKLGYRYIFAQKSLKKRNRIFISSEFYPDFIIWGTLKTKINKI